MSASSTLFPEVEKVDEKIANLLQSIVMMCGRGNASFSGIIGKYYEILCAESNGEISLAKRQIEIQKLMRDVPPDLKDCTECAFKRVDKLPLRRLSHALSRQ